MNKDFLKHFQLSDMEISKDQDPASILEDLILSQKIQEPEYLAWAKEYYGLPVLKESFFESHNQVDLLTQRYHHIFPKNTIPFYEWDGVLYVLCLEPREFHAPQKIQFILAPLSLINKYKGQEDPLVTSESAPTLTSEELPQEKIEAPTLPPENLEGLASIEKLDFSNIVPPSIGPQTSEAPAGISTEALTEVPKETLEPQAPEAPAGISEEAPEGISLTPSQETPKTPPPLSEEAPINLEPATEMPAGLSFPETPTEPLEHAVDGPILSEDLQSSSLQKEDVDAFENSQVNTKILNQMPEPEIQNLPPKLEAQVPPQTPPPIEPPPSEDFEGTHTGILIQKDGATGILNSLKKFFDQSMILLYQDGTLKPLKWDGGWKKSSHSNNLIDLTSASIFRIVVDTKHPYHGHIIPNPINDSFFQGWNQGVYPEHITIAPVLDKNKVVGMVLGTSSRTTGEKIKLRDIEAIAENCLSEVLLPQLQQAS